jgi:tRNA(Ile)-lysidine synthase
MNTPNNPLFTAIHNSIKTHELLSPGQTIILGLSGGPDSMFLLHLLAPLHQSGTITVIAAHLDHQWRHNSAHDVQFCRTAAAAFNIDLVASTLTELDLTFKFNGSQEEVGRKARRAFLEKVARGQNADAIALGHHADDQQETFFIRLLRGASLTGLTAMHPRQGMYIRPLLDVKKENILGYLHQNNIPYLTDPTNNSSDYLRNRIRNTLIPTIRTCDDRFDNTFSNTLAHLHETEQYLTDQTVLMFTEITSSSGDLDIKKWATLERFMQKRIILHWLCVNKVPFTPSAALIEEIIRFLITPRGGTHAIHQHWSFVKKNHIASIKNSLR